MKKTLIFFWLLFSVLAFSQSTYLYTYKPVIPDVKDFQGFFTHNYDIEPLDIIAMANDSEITKTSLGRYLTFPKEDGLLDGIAIVQDPKGQRLEMPFKKGKANGKAVLYNEIGKVAFETEYKDNKRNGIRKLYSSYRSYVLEANYVDDKLVGKIKVYENRNEEKGYYLFPNDLKKGIIEHFTTDGVKSIEIPVINYDIIHGDLKYYDIHGKPVIFIPYKDGNIHGKVDIVDKEAKYWYSIHFKNGKPVGKHLSYYEDFKTLEKEEHYDEDGKKTGVWKHYDQRGNIYVLIDKYVNDSIDGYKLSYTNDFLHKHQLYSKGKLHGVTKIYKYQSDEIEQLIYYENGQKIKEEDFNRGKITTVTILENSKPIKQTYFDLEGNVIHINNWKNGEKIGNHKIYSMVYRLSSDADYDENGVITRYYIYQHDGAFSKMYYSNGKQHGKQINYYAYNNKTIESYFWNGKQVSEEEFNKLSDSEKNK